MFLLGKIPQFPRTAPKPASLSKCIRSMTMASVNVRIANFFAYYPPTLRCSWKFWWKKLLPLSVPSLHRRSFPRPLYAPRSMEEITSPPVEGLICIQAITTTEKPHQVYEVCGSGHPWRRRQSHFGLKSLTYFTIKLLTDSHLIQFPCSDPLVRTWAVGGEKSVKIYVPNPTLHLAQFTWDIPFYFYHWLIMTFI